MTADYARKLAEKAKSVEAGVSEALLTAWVVAIDKAARAGERSVRSGNVSKPRTPISAGQHKAVHDKLRADGFTVKTVRTGPNEDETEVSW